MSYDQYRQMRNKRLLNKFKSFLWCLYLMAVPCIVVFIITEVTKCA